MATQQDPGPGSRVVPPLPPWLRDIRALQGIRERSGTAANHPQIVAWLKAVGLPVHLQVDETAWCAAGMHGILAAAGIKGTGRANARSYLNWGTPLLLPRVGCIAVYTRPPNPAEGHVTFWIADFGPDDLCFGANQGNACDFGLYERSRALAYRWPAGVP
jgi:uncharacterized protein (TIGR02594 family)